MSMEDTALQLWREFFGERGRGSYFDSPCGDAECFFCGESIYNEEEGHDPDCVYIRAKKLLEERETEIPPTILDRSLNERIDRLEGRLDTLEFELEEDRELENED